MLDFYVKTGTRFSLRDKRSFEISDVERTRVDCSFRKEKIFPFSVDPLSKGDIIIIIIIIIII